LAKSANQPRAQRLDRQLRGNREADALSVAEERSRTDTLILAWIAFLTIPLHLAFLLRYGWSPDELTFATFTHHLSWGYVDHPPLAALAVRVAFRLLGEELFSLRVGLAVAGALTVFLASRIARELGGGRFAQVLAALTVASAPGLLLAFHSGVADSWAILLWTAASLAFVRVITTSAPSGWIAFGVFVGLGVEADLSLLVLPAAVLAVLPWTNLRRLLATREAAIGTACMIALLLPHLLWQSAHGWPSLEFLRHSVGPWIDGGGWGPLSPIVLLGPLGLVLVIWGAVWLLSSRATGAFPILATVGILATALLIAAGGRGPGPLLVAPFLLAAGSMATSGAAGSRKAFRFTALLAVALSNAALAPLGLPMLSLPGLASYQRLLNSVGASKPPALVPSAYAREMGWPEMTKAVRMLTLRIPRPDRSRACVVTEDQSQAGALAELARGPEALPVVSGHNSEFLWGPQQCDGSTLILVGRFPGNPLRCRIDRLVTEIHCRLCSSEAEQTDLRLCLDAGGGNLARMWPQLRHVD
jgi:hypothetical protein